MQQEATGQADYAMLEISIYTLRGLPPMESRANKDSPWVMNYVEPTVSLAYAKHCVLELAKGVFPKVKPPPLGSLNKLDS